jgi:hypothetical protein
MDQADYTDASSDDETVGANEVVDGHCNAN